MSINRHNGSDATLETKNKNPEITEEIRESFQGFFRGSLWNGTSRNKGRFWSQYIRW